MGDENKAGGFIPGPLGRTFSRVPLEPITVAFEKGMPVKWAVLLMLMSHTGELGDGTVWASCSRASLCKALGISEGQTRNAVSSLIRGGIIEVLEKGHNGRATVYRVNIVGVSPETTPTTPETTPTQQKTTPTGGSSRANGERGGSRNHTYDPVGVAPETTPIRIFEEDSYKDRSSEGVFGDAEGSIKEPSINRSGYVTDLKPVSSERGRSFASLFRSGGEKRDG